MNLSDLSKPYFLQFPKLLNTVNAGKEVQKINYASGYKKPGCRLWSAPRLEF